MESQTGGLHWALCHGWGRRVWGRLLLREEATSQAREDDGGGGRRKPLKGAAAKGPGGCPHPCRGFRHSRREAVPSRGCPFCLTHHRPQAKLADLGRLSSRASYRPSRWEQEDPQDRGLHPLQGTVSLPQPPAPPPPPPPPVTSCRGSPHPTATSQRPQPRLLCGRNGASRRANPARHLGTLGVPRAEPHPSPHTRPGHRKTAASDSVGRCHL